LLQASLVGFSRSEVYAMKSLTRRQLLRIAGLGTLGAALAACQPKVVEVTRVVEQKVEVEKVVKETVVVAGTPQIVEKVVKETVITEAKPAPKTEATIRYLSWWGWFTPMLLSLMAAYKDAHPNVTIKNEEVGYTDAPPKYQTTMAAGTAADIMYHSESMSRFYDAGQILDITEMVKADGWDYLADFQDGLGADFYHGKQYGWTHMYESTAILYNKTMVQELYGKDLWDAFPDGVWEWDDMIAVAKACTKDKNGDGRIDQWGMQVNTSGMCCNLMGALGWSLGDSWVEPHTLNHDCTSEKIMEGWKMMWEWEKKDQIIVPKESVQEINKAVGTDPFYAGMTAMKMRLATDVMNTIERVGDKFEFDCIPLPKRGNRWAISEIAAHPHNIWAGSKAKEEAYNFIKFLGTEPGLMPLMNAKRFIPPIKRPDIYARLKEAYLRTPKPKHANVWIDCLDQHGGIGPIMRYDTCEEVRQLFAMEIDLLYAMSYEDGLKALPEFMAKLEVKLNENVKYSEPLPYPGEQIPRPGSCKMGDCSPVAGPNI
jgi:multiple sugar transport system substrate-binding protein